MRHALAKRPEDRWQSARDIKHAIDDLDMEPPSKPSPGRRWWPLAIGAPTLLAVAALAIMNRGAATAEPYNLSISAPPGITYGFASGGAEGDVARRPHRGLCGSDTLWSVRLEDGKLGSFLEPIVPITRFSRRMGSPWRISTVRGS